MNSPTIPTSTLAGTAVPHLVPVAYQPYMEQPEPDEHDTGAELTSTLLGIGDITFADSGQALRTVHAKSHGLLKATVRVLPLAAPYAQGLFAEPKTYDARIRLSTSPGDVLDDKVSTPRGMALKVIGVQGSRLPGAEGHTTQDFLLVNGPAFLAPTAKKFLGNLKLLAATTDKVPRLKRAFSAVLRGAEAALETVGGESGTLKGMGGHPETHILGETFYSQVPFLYGPYMAKWSVAPVSPALKALTDAKVDMSGTPDALRREVNDYFGSQQGAEWALRVQLCTDLEKMPIEDASVAWPEDLSPFVTVAHITVEPQTAWSESLSVEMDDGLSFAPWHGLAAHRPLGSVNRVRQGAYQASADARSGRGRCPVHEPGGV